MIDSDAVVNAAPNGRIFASFRHEPEARGIRRPPPVYLTLVTRGEAVTKKGRKKLFAWVTIPETVHKKSLGTKGN